MSKIWLWLKRYWVTLIIFLISVLPLAIYFYHFKSYPISLDPSDWADFGSYVGGVYTIVVSILVVYLTNHLSKKDAAWKKLQEAVGAIFVQVKRINYNKVNIKEVSKLLQLVNENELNLPSDLYVMLINLHDDYLDAKDTPEKFDVQKEVIIKQRLKKLYES